jgi:O-antigen/teichoic acid export membrane protein
MIPHDKTDVVPEESMHVPGAAKPQVHTVLPRGVSSEGRRSFSQDALLLVGNRFLIMLVSFISGIVLARSLGAGGRGLIAAALADPTMFLSLTEMGVRQSSIYYLGKHIFTDRQVVAAVCTLILLTGLVGVVVCGSLLLATGNTAFTPTIIALVVGTIPCTLVIDYSSGILLGKRLVGQFARVQSMAKVQQLVMIIVLVWWLSLGISGALIAMLLSTGSVACCALWRVSNIAPLRPSIDWHISRALLFKGAAYAISSFLMVLSQNHR